MAKYKVTKTITKNEGGKTTTKTTGPTPPYKMKFNLISASYVTRIPKPVISLHKDSEWIVTIDKKSQELTWRPHTRVGEKMRNHILKFDT